jgi:hypothetical protein
VTLTEKPDEATKPSSNDAVGVNLDKDLLESLVNLEHELTGIDTRKTLAEGSRLCDEITMETNKITKLIDSLKTESKPTTEEIQQVIAGFTTKVNDLVKYHHDNKLTDKAGKFFIYLFYRSASLMAIFVDRNGNTLFCCSCAGEVIIDLISTHYAPRACKA